MKPRPKAKERRRKRRIRRAKRLQKERTISAVERILSRPEILIPIPSSILDAVMKNAAEQIKKIGDETLRGFVFGHLAKL